MTLAEIAKQRLLNQLLVESDAIHPAEVVRWMGAIQAQDYAMSKMAVGIRAPGTTAKDVENAINHGEIIRTHVLRPTWHFVAHDDLRWMLRLSAANIKGLMKSRHRQLGIDEPLIAKTLSGMERALESQSFLPRDRLLASLVQQGIEATGERASHLLWLGEVEGLICSGPVHNGKHTYALLEKRIPKTPEISAEEALGKLAIRYFTSHGPATANDFSWWAGLGLTASRKAIEIVGNNLDHIQVGAKTYYFQSWRDFPKESQVHFLPAFDEILVSYTDRNAAIDLTNFNNVFTKNGIFKPVYTLNGRVKGEWRRTIAKDALMIEITHFEGKLLGARALKNAIKPLGYFLGKKPQLSILNSEENP